jgi:uncharacterized FlgJ-related protein
VLPIQRKCPFFVYFSFLIFFTCFSEIAFTHFVTLVSFSTATKCNFLCSSTGISQVRRRFPSLTLLIRSSFQTTYLICNVAYNLILEDIITIVNDKNRHIYFRQYNPHFRKQKSHVLKKRTWLRKMKRSYNTLYRLYKYVVLDNNLILINKIRFLEKTTQAAAKHQPMW